MCETGPYPWLMARLYLATINPVSWSASILILRLECLGVICFLE